MLLMMMCRQNPVKNSSACQQELGAMLGVVSATQLPLVSLGCQSYIHRELSGLYFRYDLVT